MLEQALNSLSSCCSASYVLAICMALSSVKVSYLHNSSSRTLSWAPPLIIYSSSRVFISVSSRNLHFFAWSMHLVMYSSISSSLACFIFSSCSLASLWLDLGSRTSLRWSQNSIRVLVSLFHVLYILSPSSPIHMRTYVFLSSLFNFDNGPLNINVTYCLNAIHSLGRSPDHTILGVFIPSIVIIFFKLF